MSCAARPDRRRLRSRQAASRLLSPCAAHEAALSRRRPAARRGLHLGLVPAEQDVREGRHLQRLPRSAQRQAARRRQRGLRRVPPAGEVRHGRRTIITRPAAPALVRRLPHAGDDLHGRRSAPRSQPARPAAGSLVKLSGTPNACTAVTPTRCALGGGAGRNNGTAASRAAINASPALLPRPLRARSMLRRNCLRSPPTPAILSSREQRRSFSFVRVQRLT